MKKTKILMTAMALPMLFAACSQDELVDNYGVQKGPDAEGFYATLSPTFDGGVDSRATWTGSKLTWDNTDKISMYWLDANTVDDVTAAKFKFNSVFKTTDGAAFTSESMVFVGGNVAVYPANLDNYQTGEDVVLTIPAIQDANTIKNIPYISNYLDIQKRTSQTGNNPGYNNGIDAPMKMAANVFNLTFELKNTAGLAAYGFAVESVELHANNAFDTKAKIYADDRVVYDPLTGQATTTPAATPYYESKQDYYNGSTLVEDQPTITKNLWVKGLGTTGAGGSVTSTLTTTAITQNADGTYTAQFVILPTDKVITSGAKIVINTTCGHVDITTPSGAGVEPKDTWIVKGGRFNDPTKTGATLEECFDAIIDAAPVVYSENSTSKFIGENTGRIFPRSIVADMNDATLDGSKVYNSADIIRYVNIYNKMGKENSDDYLMDLELSSKTTSQTFAGLTKAALAAVDGENNYTVGLSYKKYVTLSAGKASNGNTINVVEITDAGAVYDIKSLNDASTSVDLALGAGAWTMNDALALNAKIGKIINNGTLTVNGTTHPTAYYQMSLVEPIQNNGTLKIGGNGVLQVNGNLSTGWTSVTDVAAGQSLIFTADITSGLNGTINVNDPTAFLIANNGVNVTNEGVINNWGTVAAEGSLNNNGFINKAATSPKINNQYYYGGIINVKGAQTATYVYDNSKGEINMFSRQDEVMVASVEQGAIVYPYTAADGVSFKYTINDRFNTVKFGNDVRNLTLVKEMNPAAVNYDGSLAIDDLNFIFTGTTSLKAATADAFHLNKLTVNSGANLQFNSGNTITVHHLVNNGVITVGGLINYLNTYNRATTAKVYSVGYGAIVYKTTSVGTVANLQAAIAKGEDVVLTSNLTLTDAQLAGAENITISGADASTVLTINRVQEGQGAMFTKGLNLKNLTVSTNLPVDLSFGNPSGTYEEMPVFNGDCTFENVTFNKPIIVTGDAEFKNCTFKQTTGSYFVWIGQFGQTVTFDGCTFDVFRAIKMTTAMKEDFPTLGTVANPTINIKNTTIKSTDTKAAVVIQDCGATFNLSNVNIANVAADQEYFVWTDKDNAPWDFYKQVTVNGGKVRKEP